VIIGGTLSQRKFNIPFRGLKNEGGGKLYKKEPIIELEPGQTSGLKSKKAGRHRSG
jgi:hypothetical protein